MTVQQQKSGKQKRIVRRVVSIFLLIFMPLIIAGALMAGARIHSLFRYEESYFSPQYQELYPSPGPVAIALESALKNGDTRLFSELTGMKREITLEPQPKMMFSILVDVDSYDYFHYLYFDFDTFHRQTYFIKEINQRWVVVPEDLYFYFDSGQWLRVFMPLAMTWWVILAVVGILKGLSYLGARTRAAYGF